MTKITGDRYSGKETYVHVETSILFVHASLKELSRLQKLYFRLHQKEIVRFSKNETFTIVFVQLHLILKKYTMTIV